MPVRLRLSRLQHSRNRPEYSLVAVQGWKKTSAKALEYLGKYEAVPKVMSVPVLGHDGKPRGPQWGPPQAPAPGTLASTVLQLNEDRVRWWLDRGAVPTQRVQHLLERAGILDFSSAPQGVSNHEKYVHALRKSRDA